MTQDPHAAQTSSRQTQTLAVLLAAFYGYLAGLLLAPRRGVRTRQRLRNLLTGNQPPKPPIAPQEIVDVLRTEDEDIIDHIRRHGEP